MAGSLFSVFVRQLVLCVDLRDSKQFVKGDKHDVITLYSAGVGFSRHNITTKDYPYTVRVNKFLMAVDP